MFFLMIFDNLFNLSQNLQSFLKDLIIAISLLVLAYFFLKITRNIVLRQIKKLINKTDNPITAKILSLIDKYFITISYFGLFYATLKEIEFNPSIVATIKTIVIILTTFYVTRFLVDLSKILIYSYSEKYRDSDSIIERNIKALFPAIRILFWLLASISILSNLGFDIKAIVAGLGIGGVALALASQSILQDLFSYFAILFDRPFEISDLVSVGDFMGHVEHIGIKTTRIKAITGEQLILANTDLTNSRLRNFKRMEQRQITLKIGVVYETDNNKLAEIPEIIKNSIEPLENIIFDTAYFSKFGEFSLDFEVIYYVLSNDIKISRIARNQVNLAIKNAFYKQKIEFAYPTQVHYLSPVS